MAIAITNAAQLAQIGVSPDFPGNESYILQNDIQLTGVWSPLPAADGITFDGNGHLIYELSAPLFQRIDNGVVRGLALSLAVEALTAESPFYGDAGGLAIAAINTSFTNITTSGYIRAYYEAGALVAEATYCAFSNCVNQATIVSDNDAAGGFVAQSRISNLSGCVNYGNISGQEPYSVAGGIAGVFDAGYPREDGTLYTVRILDCVNYGTISSGQYGGGIAGAAGAGPYEISGCQNHGPVFPSPLGLASAEANHHYGGIAGWLANVVNYPGGAFDCFNKGSVSGGSSVGGIAGEVSNYPFEYEEIISHVTTNIARCQNAGTVSLFAAGLAPNPYYPREGAGGIAGVLRFAVALIDSANNGAVFSDAPHTGGIVGQAVAGVVENSVNTGPVSGSANVGGIAGSADRATEDNSIIPNNAAAYLRAMRASTGPRHPDSIIERMLSSRLYIPVPEEINKSVLNGNTNAQTATVSASGNNSGGVAGHIANGALALNNRSCAALSSGGNEVGGVVGLADYTQPTGANEISGSLVSSPSLSGNTAVYRVLGCGAGSVVLLNTQVFPDILLSGNNSGKGGLVYNNQPVAADDPQLGATLQQGETLVCPLGQRLESCLGCVPGAPPCEPCPCMPGVCRPGTGDSSALVRRNNPPGGRREGCDYRANMTVSRISPYIATMLIPPRSRF